MDPCYPFQMLLAANQRNPLGVSSHHRWTRVSTLYASSCGSFSPRRHSPALNLARTGPRLLVRLLPLAAPAARAVNALWMSHWWLWENEVSASDRDAELCNDESDKYPEVGAAGRRRGGRASAGALWRLHGETRERESTERPRREPCALPSAEPFCSPLTHSSFPGTLHHRQGALSYAVTRLEEPYRGVRGRGGTR